MEIKNSNFNAANALNNSLQDVRNGAAKIASKASIEGKLNTEKEMIDMKQSSIEFSSVAKALKTENEMIGFFLNEKI